jgi:hypothetical protein
MTILRDWAALGLGQWRAVHQSLLTEADRLLKGFEESRTIPVHAFAQLLKRVQLHNRSEERSLFSKLPQETREVLLSHHNDLECCLGSDVRNKAAWLRSVTEHFILEEELVWLALSALKPKDSGDL